jgi:hypothetical protein
LLTEKIGPPLIRGNRLFSDGEVEILWSLTNRPSGTVDGEGLQSKVRSLYFWR